MRLAPGVSASSRAAKPPGRPWGFCFRPSAREEFTRAEWVRRFCAPPAAARRDVGQPSAAWIVRTATRVSTGSTRRLVLGRIRWLGWRDADWAKSRRSNLDATSTRLAHSAALSFDETEPVNPFTIVNDELSAISARMRQAVTSEVPALATGGVLLQGWSGGEEDEATVLLLMASALTDLSSGGADALSRARAASVVDHAPRTRFRTTPGGGSSGWRR